MTGRDRDNQSYLSKLSPWNRSPVVPPSQGAQGEPELLQQQKGQDHVVKARHRLLQYPKDCPRLRPCWFHATDVPKRRPSPAAGETKEEKPAAQPKKYIAFSVNDSKAIEAAFQNIIDDEDGGEKTSLEQSGGDIALQGAGHSRRSDGKPNTNPEDEVKSVKVKVNEDYLFDVDVKRRELSPAYWLGPVYDVRRGTWFYEGTPQRPCDENLAAQLEEGYLKTKAWKLVQTEQAAQKSRSASQPRERPSSWAPGLRAPVSTQPTPQASSDDLRSRAAQQATGQGQSDVTLESGQFEQPPNTHRLFGAHMNSVVTYQDGTTAWLLTDDFLSRVNYSVYQRFAGGGHFAGLKMTRGYINPDKKLAEKAEPADKSAESSNASGKGRPQEDVEATAEANAEEHPSQRPSVSETRRSDLARHMSSLLEEPSSKDPERQDEELRKRDEREIEDDYNEIEGDEQGREIEHLILVTHGIGQRLGLRLEAVNFVSDVNLLRKTLKAVYADSPDLRALNAELGNTEHVNSRVQVLPICWRHLLDFPKQSVKHNRNESRKEQDIADTEIEDEEEFPSLEDITVEGIPAVRGLVSDLVLDVLLYNSPLYQRHISRIVLEESNRIHQLYIQRNPNFNGKVSLIGHSLGSAVLFDILCRKDQQQHLSKAHDRDGHHQQLEFEVEDFFALGSPIGLFQMLKGRSIVAREPVNKTRKNAMTTSTDDPMMDGPSLSSRKASAPKGASPSADAVNCQNLHNIFHNNDVVAYRLEPLISPAMAALKPQPLPYTKRGIFGAPIGQGLTGIGTRVSQGVSSMWSSMASSLLTRGLGYSGSEPGPVGTSGQSVSKSSGPLPLNAGVIPTAPLPAKGTEIARLPEDGQTGLGSDAAATSITSQHPPTLIDADLETLSTDFQKRRRSVQSDAQTRDLGAGGVGSDEWREAEERIKRLRREEGKVRKLNSNGRADYAIQEGAFDINLIAAIASHLSYWSDEDVSHYIISQLLSRHRIVRPTAGSGTKTQQM
ncbi:hypothetical protein LTR91_012759 [Friedmanniomyces endolithicus]|uniref:DDHD domain-containing protein n=1 Tax=Friedmanniomyces endolithicus TaxID=329885 RepID=A0AAN6QQC2_9PEZI|nr:hypothetical protein LTR57_010755 [Friedmanniomyces endolithicus]KAK0978919.1 hypothetical protein LTR91_012759 [Friedmanniomyces endolithicus]KAK1039426.1 hypothetical protein LTS16_011242 [Friedmanniomyces endolithicus]